jgi:hypothetical protein
MKFFKWTLQHQFRKLENNIRSWLWHGMNNENKNNLIRHPDKNPTCGKECAEKFDQVF